MKSTKPSRSAEHGKGNSRRRRHDRRHSRHSHYVDSPSATQVKSHQAWQRGIQLAPATSDDLLRRDVRDRLDWNEELDATHIEVHVAAGEVTLEGCVTSPAMKPLAIALARSVRGVLRVHNAIDVTSS